MEEKICPINGKQCGSECGFYAEAYGVCALTDIAACLNAILENMRGEGR